MPARQKGQERGEEGPGGAFCDTPAALHWGFSGVPGFCATLLSACHPPGKSRSLCNACRPFLDVSLRAFEKSRSAEALACQLAATNEAGRRPADVTGRPR